MKDNNKVARCPITFIGNKIVQNDDINSIFFAPHEISIITDIENGFHMDRVRKNITSEEELSSIGRQYSSIYRSSFVDGIVAYAVMNIDDVLNQFMLYTKSKYCSFVANNKNTKHMFNRFSRANHANENYDGNITGIRFAQSISDILYGFCDQNPSLLYINLNSFFSTIFDQFVALRLDKEISNTANDIARNSLYCADIIKDYDIDDEDYDNYNIKEYKYFYKMVNGSYPSKEEFDPNYVYTFVSSWMREMIQFDLVNLRKSLDLIAKNIVDMFLRDYLEYYYPDNFINKNYTIKDGLKETYPELMASINKKLEEKDD